MASPHPLLVTKLHVPPLQAGWVRRERLLERLAGLVEKKCALVIAPAGYGKSVLLAQWIAAGRAAGSSFHFGWLTLDEGDNDPVRFWAYFAAALPEPQAGAEFLALLQSPPLTDLRSPLVLLINALSALPGDSFLVLDEIQVLSQPAVLDSLSFFLEHLPPNLHLAFAGRSDPALGLARLRAGGQILELRAPDLRFTRPEIERFFADSAALPLDPQELALLDEQSEGWIAGLQLAALSLAASSDRAAWIRSFTGSDRNLVDYLAEEILNRQSPVLQDFLLRTSLLERLCAPLCAALLDNAGGEAAQAFLDAAERANLFLVPLDNRRAWYRYHRLFADLLQARLLASQPDLIPGLHRRAALWLAQNQFPFEAFRQAAAAGDLELAAGLVRAALPELAERGETASLETWLALFPPAFIAAHPALCLGQAWASLYRLDFAQADAWARRSLDCLPPDAEQNWRDALGQAAALRATVAINFRDHPAAIRFSNQALDYLEDSPRWDLARCLINLNLGDASSAAGEHEAAARAYRRALQPAFPPANPMIEAVVIGSLGNLYLRLGRLREAEAVLSRIFALEEAAGPLPAAGKPLVYLARLALERNQLERAAGLAKRALELCLRWNHPDHIYDALAAWAEICAVRGEWAACHSALAQARAHIRGRLAALSPEKGGDFLSGYERSLQQLEARVRLRESAGASDSGLAALPQDPDVVVLQDPASAVLMGRAWLRAGRGKEVLAQSEELARLTAQNGWAQREIQAHLLQALANDALGRTAAAQAEMAQALDLAQPEGFVRLFLDGGPAAERVLTALQPREDLRAFAQQIRQGFAPVLATPALPPAVLLSEREVQVLRLLAAGRSNAGIAAELVLSLNTVKTHLKRIYEKLGAGSRAEAVSIATQMGYLSPANQSR